MSFLELARARHSVREYQDRPVERGKIERCIEAARLAPSACNSQPWRFIVIDDPALRGRVARETFSETVTFNRFVMSAPVIVVIVCERGKISAQFGSLLKNKRFNLIDIGIAAEHVCLQAAEEQLGTCILGWFNEARIKQILGIPRLKRIGLLIALGYPANHTRNAKTRKPLDQILTYNLPA